MLAFFAVFEHLSNIRRLINRFHGFYISPTRSTTKSNTQISLNSNETTTEEQQRDLLLGPVLNNIITDQRLNSFDDDFHEDLLKQDYFARELDACLLEMRDIERDLYKLKQRQCHFYERYLDFIDKKDQLIDKFIEYHDEYLLNQQEQSISPITTTKQLRRQSTIYEFNVPVSNRFELFKRQHTLNLK